MSVALVKYEAARHALAEARSVDEAKDIKDKAEALRVYAHQANDIELESAAAEIKLRAVQRIGEISAELETSKGGSNPTATLPTGGKSKRAVLKDAGISTSAANRYEKIAAVPRDEFESYIAECKEKKQPVYAKEAIKRVQSTTQRKAAEAEHGPHRTNTIADLAALADSGEQFKVIYADPSWTFKVYSGKGKSRSAESHYNTMTQEQIEALSEHVSRLAADDCVLFLWAVMPQLPEALRVIEAWGFTYKTVGFTWAKQNKSGDGFFTGMGYWTRANAEVCLLATKGSPKRLNADVMQLIVAPVAEHSKKPDETRERICRLIAGPYLELYGRTEIEGWTVWGNETST